MDNLISLYKEDFLGVIRTNIDVVYMHPPKVEFDQERSYLDKLIGHAMKLASNVILLLHPQTNIEAVASIIHKWADNLSWMKDFCSASIEKIY